MPRPNSSPAAFTEAISVLIETIGREEDERFLMWLRFRAWVFVKKQLHALEEPPPMQLLGFVSAVHGIIVWFASYETL